MKSFFVIALLIAAAAAAPQTRDGDAQIIAYESDNIGVDGFRYSAETSNGIKIAEEGQIVDVGTQDEGISVRGQFSYVGEDNVVYTVTYVADKNGFQPSGAHIPQA